MTLLALVLALQATSPPLIDLDLRPPLSEEVSAAEARDRRRLPVILKVCREAVRSGDLETHVKRFADRNGLSSYGRLALAQYCRVYRQGVRDGVPDASK